MRVHSVTQADSPIVISVMLEDPHIMPQTRQRAQIVQLVSTSQCKGRLHVGHVNQDGISSTRVSQHVYNAQVVIDA